MTTSKFSHITAIVSFVFLATFLMPVENTYASDSPLCFTARNGKVTVSFDIVNATHTIQYSTDNINWNTYVSGTKVTIDANKSICFRAETNQTIATAFAELDGHGSRSSFHFVSSDGGTVEGSGNIMSLYGPDCPDLPLQPRAFEEIFKGCDLLTTAPELPATILADFCYCDMFCGCTSLSEAPELPAVTLATGCYYNMFLNCFSLTEAPALSAITLAEACYSQMFFSCTSLTEAPALPATTLAEGCYANMFVDCFSLTIVPALPATTLAEICYQNMFANCYSLTVAPALPATALAEACYWGMFSGCSSLTAPPALPATTLAQECYSNMFRECSSLTTPPALPATILKQECYSYMFAYCSSLTTLPELPATTLAQECYSGMFGYCTSLRINSEAPGTPWQIPSNATPAASWNRGMFFGTGGAQILPPEIGKTYYVSDAKTGTEDIAVNNVITYSNEGRIFVTGVAGETVAVYDANGRLVAKIDDASDTQEFYVESSGVYFVYVGDNETKKVIVK